MAYYNILLHDACVSGTQMSESGSKIDFGGHDCWQMIFQVSQNIFSNKILFFYFYQNVRWPSDAGIVVSSTCVYCFMPKIQLSLKITL